MRASFQLAPFEARHLDEAVRLSRAAGWPHRREDWALTLSIGAGVVARDGDRLVGTAIATFNGADHATIGLVIVDAARRGMGLGRQLMGAALDLCGTRETRLTATPDGLPLYRSLGFIETGAIAQHQGERVAAASSLGVDEASLRIDRAGADDLPVLLDFDRRATGMDRATLLAALAARGSFVIGRRGGEPVGFAGARAFGRGVVVGPAAALSGDIARALIGAQLADHAGGFLRVDAPTQSGLSAWLESLGLGKKGEDVTMARPGRIAVPRPTSSVAVYALASHAFG